MSAEWKWYFDALEGNRAPPERGNPQTGFYRSGNSAAVAIWREGDDVCCVKTTWKDGVARAYYPAHLDEIDEAFGFACVNPISHEVYEAFVATGKWPDHVEVPEVDETLPANEQVRARIEALQAEFAAWLATLPDGISNDAEDAKVAAFAKRVADLKKEAEDTHKSEKAPHLEAGRLVDQTWKPVAALADDAKRAILAPSTTYRVKRAKAEQEKREAEIARQREEQAKQANAGERPAPVMMPPKRATGLRPVTICILDDVRAVAEFIAKLNDRPADFDDVCRTLARRMLDAGVDVPGARLEKQMRAA